MRVYYPAIIERGEHGFGAFFPDLPGCVSAGVTVQEAAEGAAEALELHLAGMAEDREPLPEPSDIAKLEHDPEVDEVARLLVPAELPGRAVRVTITLPEALVAAVDRYAAEHGFTKSGLLAQAVREKIGHTKAA